jgi:hypothetical protein
MRTWISLAILAIVSTVGLWGQGTDLGTIRGTVTDPTGAVVPKAEVEVIDTATNIARKFTTDEQGNFEVGGIRSGTYKVRVAVAGFNTAEILDVVVRPGGIVRADVALKPKTTQETVVVTSEAPLIQTESQVISGTLDGDQLLALPRDSRDIYAFLYLNPNITQSGDGGFKFIGNQSYGASFSLDGQRSNGAGFGSPTASQPSLETIGELTVQSFDFTAEYAGVSNIRVTTRRGTNQYHGSLFHNNKNFALAAWSLNEKRGQSLFLPTSAQSKFPLPNFNLNELGGSFGGPVPMLKNTFFFAAYERRWFNQPLNTTSTSLPHPTVALGDFSRMNDNVKPVIPAGVTLTAAEIANDTVGGLGQRLIRIPSRLRNPTTAKLVELYFPQVNPAAPINATNGRLTDFFFSAPRPQVRDLGTFRLDHDFSQHDRFYAVYNGQGLSDRTGYVQSPYTGLGLTQFERSNHTVSLSHTHVWTNVVNEARGGFNRQETFRQAPTTLRQFLQSIGFDSSDISAYAGVVGEFTLDTFGHPALQLGNYALLNNGGRNTNRPLNENAVTFGDTLSWVKERHAFKFGGDFVRNSVVDGFTMGRGNPRGRINYTGQGIDGITRFLMGLPPNSVNLVNITRGPMDVHNWEMGFFLIDEWKVNSQLTLNLGLRYEINTPFIENNDLLINFDADFRAANGQRGRFVVPSERTMQFMDPRYRTYGVVTADQMGLPRSLIRTDYNNLAPRVGGAWRFAHKMVLRGGYGLFYPTAAAQGIRDPMATNSFQVGITKNNTAAAPLSGWPGATHGFSPLTGGAQGVLSGAPSSANNVPFDLQSPRIQQYNVTFERELGWRTAARVSYLGTRMSGLISGPDENMIPPNDTPYGTTIGDGVTPCNPANGDCQLSPADIARRPYPGLGTFVSRFRNFGVGKSNALQLEFNRQSKGTFFFGATYTLLDQKATAPDTGNSSLGGNPYNQFDSNSDYGTDAFVSRHRFISYGNWQIPYGRGKRYGSSIPKSLDWIAGGWEPSWNMFIKSGTGFSPYWFCNGCDPVMPGNVASESLDATGAFVGTSFRPIVNGEPHKTVGDRIWDPSVFGLMPFGADLFSNPKVAVRNLLRGPGTWGANLGVRKLFRFGERWRAELAADFNNIFNHPLKSPTDFGIANLGTFDMGVDPVTRRPMATGITPNPDFGRLISSFSQEGIDARRTTRLKLRITF